jgi:hypothetical protein
MSRKIVHIIEVGYQSFAVDSITAATAAIAVLSKLKKVRLNHSADNSDRWFFEPDEDSHHDKINLKLHQKYRDPKTEPKPKEKTLALPAPKRGTILCICEKSYVAPKQSCPHCGRPFSESHNRTHGDARPVKPTLRIVE